MWGRRRWSDRVDVEHPGRPDPRGVRFAARVLLPLVRLLYRPTLTGVDALPEGPFVLVANHSGGLGIAEGLCFAALYLRDVGAARPLAVMVLPTDFHVPLMRDLVRAMGAIPSTRAAAEQTLRAGVPVLVFPGGDHEALRPLWQAGRVDLGGRTGFLRVARAAAAPVVPLGIRGGHWTAPPLFRARWLAWLFVVPRLLGAKRWSISLLGALGAVVIACLPLPWPACVVLAWLWLGSPLAFLPWVPATVRLRIGAPLAAHDLFPTDDDGALAPALATVEHAMQALVDP